MKRFNVISRGVSAMLLAMLMVTTLLPVQTQAAGAADVWDGTIAAGYAGGTGTQTDPYRIETAEQLAYMAQKINSDHRNDNRFTGFSSYQKYYELMADIDLNNLEWTPIGKGEGIDETFGELLTTGAIFMGYFDGNGHTVSNLRITKAHYANGLFGAISGKSSLSDLTVQGVIDIDTTTHAYVGLVAGNATRANNIHASGSIVLRTKGNHNFLGGVFGSMGALEDSGLISSNVDISLTAARNPLAAENSLIGGIAGGTIGPLTGCVANGTITVRAVDTNINVGGIVGTTKQYKIARCISNVDMDLAIELEAMNPLPTIMAGGITSKAQTGGFDECLNTGDIKINSSNVQAGGLVGWLQGYNTNNLNCMERCANIGDLDVSAAGGLVEVGGLVGYMNHTIVRNSYSTGDVKVNIRENGMMSLGYNRGVGGLVGMMQVSESNDQRPNAHLELCWYTGTVSLAAGKNAYSGMVGMSVDYAVNSAFRTEVINCIGRGPVYGYNHQNAGVESGTVLQSLKQVDDPMALCESLGFDVGSTWVAGADGLPALRFIQEGDDPMTANAALANVKISDWARHDVVGTYIKEVADLSVLGSDFTKTTTRLQFCNMVVAVVENGIGRELEAAPSGTFSDCDDLNVRKAYQAGIVNGVGGGRFDPNGPLDRQTLATMLIRGVVCIYETNGRPLPFYTFTNMNSFPDKSEVDDWAYQSVDRLTAWGIMKGTTNAAGKTVLAPKASCTIEQSLSLINRYMNNWK